jgi:DNA-binding LytR/AlgR family response regulator
VLKKNQKTLCSLCALCAKKNNRMIQILIIEDEPIIAKDIVYAVEDLGYTVLDVCSDHKTALVALEKRVPDLVLCDIMLEGDDWDGIRLSKEIRKLYNIPLIFLTALTDAATISRAAAAEPDAYLTKPFEVRNLYVAIELAISKFALRQETPPQTVENSDNRQSIASSDFLPFIAGSFFIKDKKRLVKVSAEDIFWIKADGVYSQLATANRTFLLTTHLGAIEEKLKNLPFLRVHRSYLINFKHIDAIEEDVLTIGTERIPLGKSYREAFYRQLQQL